MADGREQRLNTFESIWDVENMVSVKALVQLLLYVWEMKLSEFEGIAQTCPTIYCKWQCWEWNLGLGFLSLSAMSYRLFTTGSITSALVVQGL